MLTVGHKDKSGKFHPHSNHTSAIHASDIHSDNIKKKLFAIGAEPIHRQSEWGYGLLTHRCQKCGGEGNKDWFNAHKKTHPNFDREHHYKIHQELQSNPRYRLRRHHELGSHSKYCNDSDKYCQMSHLGSYNGKSYKPFS